MRGHQHSINALTNQTDTQVRVCGAVEREVRCARRMPSSGREQITAASDNNAVHTEHSKVFWAVVAQLLVPGDGNRCFAKPLRTFPSTTNDLLPPSRRGIAVTNC
jgi:hypothetical protein